MQSGKEENTIQTAYRRFRFGRFVLDVDRGSLLRDGKNVPLRPKTFEVLHYMIRHQGVLVTRAQLHDAMWPNVEVSDESLTQCLAEIRKALDDASHEMIRTVPRRGYLFDVPVTGDTPIHTTSQPGTADAAIEASGPRTSRRLIWGVISALAVVVALLALDRLVLQPKVGPMESGTAQAQAPLDDKFVAVLPFINRSMQTEDEYFAAGMHDELLTRLSRISALNVISRTSVMRYRDTQMSIPEIARELGAGTILEGGVQRSGDQVRINVQLINANTDVHLWSEIYDRELTAQSLFAIQSEITSAITRSLQATLSPDEESRVFGLPTDNLEAYKHYLRGRQLMVLGNRAELEQALEAFNMSTGLDPDFALAWVGIADVTGALISIGALEWDEDLVKYQQAVERAMAINDQLGEVHTALARLYEVQGEGEKADEAYLRAIELAPSSAIAYERYATSLRGFDERATRLQILYKAAQLDPVSLSVQLSLARALGSVNRDDEARQVIYTALEREPDFAAGYRYLAQADSHNGQLASAISHFRKALEIDPANGPNLGAMAMQYLALDDFDAVAGIRAEMVRQLGPDNTQVVLIDHEILQARANWKEAIERMENLPKNATSWHTTPWRTTFLYWSAEQYDKALESLLEWQPNVLNPESWNKGAGGALGPNCTYAGILIGAGQQDLGRQLMKKIIQFIEDTPEAERLSRLTPRAMAHCYVVAGDQDRGIEMLEEAIPGHSLLWTWYYWRHWPDFKHLEGTPRYDRLVETINALLDQQRALLETMNED